MSLTSYVSIMLAVIVRICRMKLVDAICCFLHMLFVPFMLFTQNRASCVILTTNKIYMFSVCCPLISFHQTVTQVNPLETLLLLYGFAHGVPKNAANSLMIVFFKTKIEKLSLADFRGENAPNC